MKRFVEHGYATKVPCGDKKKLQNRVKTMKFQITKGW